MAMWLKSRGVRKLARTAPALACALLIAGCTTSPSTKLATCLDDSSSCIAKRKSTFNALMADPKREWIDQAPSPAVYATGVRLFAYRRSQGKLSCGELATGIAETGRSRQTLSGGVNGASKTRIGQIVALSDDINAELKRTARGKRCPKG